MFQAALFDTMKTTFAPADSGVDFHSVDAECAVAINRNDLPVRHGKGCGDCERNANAKAAECARIHVRAGGQPGACEAQQVTAISDCDVVLRGRGGDGVKNHTRMNFAVAAGRRSVFGGLGGGNAVAIALAQAISPGLVDAAFAIAGGRDHRFKCKMRRGEQLRLAAPIVDQLTGAIRHPNEARIGKNGRRAVADLVVELAPDSNDAVEVFADVDRTGIARHHVVAAAAQFSTILFKDVEPKNRSGLLCQMLVHPTIVCFGTGAVIDTAHVKDIFSADHFSQIRQDLSL